MPELPEVEAVVRKLRKAAVGATISYAQVLRPRVTHPQPPGTLAEAAGLRIRSVERRGKNIVVWLEGGLAVRVHLRMTGNLYVIPDCRLHTHTVRVLLGFTDGRGMVLDDPRLLGTMHLHTNDEIAAKLEDIGIDPLTREFTPEALVGAAKRSKRPAKVFLMDQKPVSGLGNIYAAESLFRARIHPQKVISMVSRARVVQLHEAIRAVLQEAIPAAVRTYTKPGEHAGMTYFVYGRKDEPCRVCGRNIRRIEQAGRSTYYCPGCQRI